MIIVDTNIISELMKPSPSIKVIEWLDQQDPEELYTTTITIAEIMYGLNSMGAGHRKQELEDSFNHAIKEAFLYRVLPFTESSAHVYGKIMAHRKQLGKPLSILDGQIAAITIAEAGILATRNVNDFLNCGLEWVNPFD